MPGGSPFFSGLFEGFNQSREGAYQQNLKSESDARAQEAKVYQALLQSNDKGTQALALSGLMESARPGQRKKGLRGWMGEVQQGDVWPQLKAHMDEMVPDEEPPQAPSAPTHPGSAALPSTTPVQGGSTVAPADPTGLPAPQMASAGGGAEGPAAPAALATPPADTGAALLGGAPPPGPPAALVPPEAPPEHPLHRRGTGLLTAEEIRDNESRRKITEQATQDAAAGTQRIAEIGVTGQNAIAVERLRLEAAQAAQKLTPDEELIRAFKTGDTDTSTRILAAMKAEAEAKKDPAAAAQLEQLRAIQIQLDQANLAAKTTADQPLPDWVSDPHPLVDAEARMPEPSMGGRTRGAIDSDAQQLMTRGAYPAQGLGNTPVQKTVRAAVESRADALARSLGMSVPDVQALYRANAAGLSTSLRTAIPTVGFANQALLNLDLAEQQMHKVGNTSSPLANRFVNYLNGQVLTGSPDRVALENFIYAAGREYAKSVMGGAASARELSTAGQGTVQRLLSAAQSEAGFTAAAQAIRQELGNTIAVQQQNVRGVQTGLASNTAGLGGPPPVKPGSTPVAATPPAAPPARPVPAGQMRIYGPRGATAVGPVGTAVPAGWSTTPP